MIAKLDEYMDSFEKVGIYVTIFSKTKIAIYHNEMEFILNTESDLEDFMTYLSIESSLVDK